MAQNEILHLRPHHLLCTLGYEGKGYDDDFKKHMNGITKRLRSGEDLTIEIVNSTDDICAKCPNMLAENLCEKQSAILAHDQRVFDALDLEEKCYGYAALKTLLRTKVTPQKLCTLCGECMWLPLTNCRSLIIDFLEEDCG